MFRRLVHRSLVLAIALILLLSLDSVAPARPTSAAGVCPGGVTPIGTARAAGVGWSGSLCGNVIVTPGTFDARTFAIQDATGGMYVFKSSGGIPAMALGDVVQTTGTLTLYNGLLEMDPTTAIVNLGSGTVPAAQAISTAPTVVNSTQGLLIQVTGTVTWGTNPPAPDGTTNWTMYINDGSGQLPVYVDKETFIDMRSYISPTKLTITGFSSNYNRAEIWPRYQTDIVDTSDLDKNIFLPLILNQ